MRWIDESTYGVPVVELTRRNLTVLLEKLDNPASEATIMDGGHNVAVRAVEDAEHYSDRPAGAMYMPDVNGGGRFV